MRRLRNELTPGQVMTLWNESAEDTFVFMLMERGYKLLGGGCYKTVYRRPRGRYVVKIASLRDDLHTNGRAIRRRYLLSRCRRSLVAPLVWNSIIHVQRYVRECSCHEGLPGYPDSSGHNHGHINGRLVLFDY